MKCIQCANENSCSIREANSNVKGCEGVGTLKQDDDRICAFCGNPSTHDNVKTLIASPNADICDKCVLLCMELLISHLKKSEIQFPGKVEE